MQFKSRRSRVRSVMFKQATSCYGEDKGFLTADLCIQVNSTFEKWNVTYRPRWFPLHSHRNNWFHRNGDPYRCACRVFLAMLAARRYEGQRWSVGLSSTSVEEISGTATGRSAKSILYPSNTGLVPRLWDSGDAFSATFRSTTSYYEPMQQQQAPFLETYFLFEPEEYIRWWPQQ